MNYDYQTIAHNTVTVTDPRDTVPAPGKKGKTRPIANDGGQRRIGSGWGVEAAPLDRAEWEAKRDIYHTASMGPLLDRDGLAVAVADITPAYTNRQSGTGTFSARTRRVERFWRTFGYDRVDDVVVVFDQVTSTKASFRKRWLLHTLEAPQVTAHGFSVSVLAQDRPGHAGGELEGKVLLPKGALIEAIGGPGFEFFVDGKNYDENGKLKDMIKKLGPNRGEPGAWRIEVSPPQGQDRGHIPGGAAACGLGRASDASRSAAGVRAQGRVRNRRSEAHHSLVVRAGPQPGRHRCCGWRRRAPLSCRGAGGAAPRAAGLARTPAELRLLPDHDRFTWISHPLATTQLMA